MLANAPELLWRERGAGTSRDARIAYSGLFGRYLARAFLAELQDVIVLVPLEAARSCLQRSSYRIAKRPLGQGLQADWIGLTRQRLVIAEAKGTFDRAVGSWRGTHKLPSLVDTAMGQARRTRVIRFPLGPDFPAQRWGVVSRWATEENGREPTIVAAYERGQRLKRGDWRALARILFACDVRFALQELGYRDIAETIASDRPTGLDRAVGISVGGREIEPGFPAAAGPFGILPIRDDDDIELVRMALAADWPVAVLTLSERYVRQAVEDVEGVAGQFEDWVGKAGLTVVWPRSTDAVTMRR